MKKEFVCIVCPRGCELTVNVIGDSIEVNGNHCKKGIPFAKQEVTDPQRVMTTTLKLTNGELLPVKTSCMVKKHEVKKIVNQLKTVVLSPPVSIGEIVIRSVGENKADIIACDSVK